jgi:hypothetical protein
MKIRQDKRIIKLDFLFCFFQIYLFGAYIKEMSTFTFGAWSFLLVHIQFTPSEGPKGFVN